MYALTHLHLGSPRVWRPSLLTLVTLLIFQSEINAESLLQHRIVLNLLLDSKLELNPATVRFCPDEFSV
jgi:hypothetical protein